jgi:hypothetical protein
MVTYTKLFTGPHLMINTFANLFYFFFIAQIFSPSIGGVTIYIEILIALLTPGFINSIFSIKMKFSAVFLLIVFLCISLFNSFVLLIKVISGIVSVLYIKYTYESNNFYIYRYYLLSAFIACLQFLFLFIDPQFSNSIGPENLANIAWGNYATQSSTNFYSILGVDRVSGLSRESGFFASLIVSIAAIYILDKNKIKSKFIEYSLIIGWFISLSKMSFLIFFVVGIIKFRKYVVTINYFVAVILFFITILVLSNNMFDFIMAPGNDTFLHRFGGYIMIFDLNVKQFLFGLEDATKLQSILNNVSYYDFYAGLAGQIIKYGLLVFLTLLILIKSLGADTAGILILFLATVNVDLVTNQNFVIAIYFVIICQMRSVQSTRDHKFNASLVSGIALMDS